MNMIWIKKRNPMLQEIKEFAHSRRHYSTTNNYVEYLYDFVKTLGVENYDDITEDDVYTYIKSVQLHKNRESEKIKITQALFLFVRYMKLKNESMMPQRGRGRPQKVDRNEEMVELRKKKHTFDEIAAKYKLNKKTVYEIIKRYDSNL